MSNLLCGLAVSQTHDVMDSMFDTLQFQPGAQEGIVEMTPLSHAAGKGMDAMVELLINNGANINYLCSVRACVGILQGTCIRM